MYFELFHSIICLLCLSLGRSSWTSSEKSVLSKGIKHSDW